jgi:Ser/Thr protein kinase RdoA (MazF antagonist)
VPFRGVSVLCSLQSRLDGQRVEKLSTDQARAVGELLGRWHVLSEQRAAIADGAVHHDSRHLEHALDDLRILSTTGAITQESRHPIEQATARACRGT